VPDVLITLNDREVTRATITQPETTIGRDDSCHVRIDSPAISRLHATVIANEAGYALRDNASENGISVNGEKVMETTLQFDSSVGLGKFRLQLVESEPNSLGVAPAPRASGGPRNIVETVTIADEDARKIQERLKSGPPKSAAPIRRNVETGGDYGWLWWAGAAFVVAFGLVVAMRIFGG